jgi:hypothetical protein
LKTGIIATRKENEVNAIEIHARMPLVQLVARLLQLAEHRTPAAIQGYETPTVPVPIHEWALLREASARLARMDADLTAMRRSAQARDMDKHPDWAVVDARGRIIWAASNGRAQAEDYIARAAKTDEMGFTRTWTVRPLTVGGVRVAEEEELNHAA